MTATPSPPRRPEPAGSSRAVAIALLALALIVIVCGMTILVGLRFLSHNFGLSVRESASGVNIKTPVGSFDVRKEVSEAQLGLPLYPGAQRVQEHGGATISLGLPENNHLRILAAKYTTPDSSDKVRDYYQQQLGSQVTKFVEKDEEGKTVFEIKQPKERKIVSLKPGWDGTEIALVRIVESAGETN